jgi:hypothetical protein
MLEEINEKLTPAPILDLEATIIDALEPINKPFEEFDASIEGGIDALAEDIFPEGHEFAD